MPRIVTVAGLFVALLGPVNGANAQEPAFGGGLQPRIVQGVVQTPQGAQYVGGYSNSGGTQRHVIQFYAFRDPGDRSPEGTAYVSIPIASRMLETGTTNGSRVWADGRTCSALYGVVYEFTRFAPPFFHAPRLHPEPAGASRLGAPSMSIHSGSVSIWGYARQADGAPMTMVLTGTDGIIARWVAFAEEQLAGCWSPQEPLL